MTAPSNFAAFILTHGRPDRVFTLRSLRRSGYTGRVVILIDNEDATAAGYHSQFGEMVQVFDKAEVAARIDEGDNFGDRRAIVYARNACFDVAARLGIRDFIQLDDDYLRFSHRRDENRQYQNGWLIKDLDAVFAAMLDYYRSIPAASIAMAQGGDFMGGDRSKTRYDLRRKAMNSFICSTERRFEFSGRINEDVNTYAALGAKGLLFLTVQDVSLQQRLTQSNPGGMTEMYRESGTYVKSFYSVMFQPSSVRVNFDPNVGRLHHRLRWRYTVPVLLHERHRKADPECEAASPLQAS